MIHVLTYATHSQGMLDKLIKNSYDINVKVLGWNSKWNGLRDKPLGVLKELEKLNDNDIVVFLDGFDSVIKKPLCEALLYFEEIKKTNPKMRVLLSKEQCYNKQNNIFLRLFFRYTQNRIYKCNNNVIVNSGLYMGHVKELKILLNDHKFNNNKNIDQILLNKIYWKYDFVEVDINNIIFYNCAAYMNDDSKSCFTQYPGIFSFNRIKRAILMDYNHCFKKEIAVMKILFGICLIYISFHL